MKIFRNIFWACPAQRELEPGCVIALWALSCWGGFWKRFMESGLYVILLTDATISTVKKYGEK